MKDQLQTIRAALAFLDARFGWSPGEAPAIDALREATAQLEAMVGSQEPVAWMHPTQGHMQRRTETMSPEVVASYERGGWTPLYTAAPVAQQQEPVKPCCMNFAAGTNCFSDPRIDCPHLPPVAQQPVVEWQQGAGKLLIDKPLPDKTLLYAGPVAQQPPAWWPAVENILNEYGLQAIDFVADWKAAQQPQCHKRANDYCKCSRKAMLCDGVGPAQQPQAEVGNSGFDHKTAADFLSGKTVSDEAMRKFVQASRWAHDDRASLQSMLLSVRNELASREAEIALLKKELMDAEAAPQQAEAVPAAHPECDCGREGIHEMHRPACAHAKSKVAEAVSKADARYLAHIESEWRSLNHQKADEVPPGYVLVPVEPTDAMLDAGARVLNQRAAEQCNVNADDQWFIYGEDFKGDVRAVLDAAIAQQKGQP